MFAGRRKKKDGGAAMVEMAFVLPLLLLIVMGIIEFGFLFGQFNEIRHGAHEGARLAAVNDSSLVNNTCNSMNLGGAVTLDFTDGASGVLGDQASVTVTLDRTSLSGVGLIEIFLPTQLVTTADFRLEQNSTLWDDLTAVCP
jgi:Flp pilus assembly protein TadG